MIHESDPRGAADHRLPRWIFGLALLLACSPQATTSDGSDTGLTADERLDASHRSDNVSSDDASSGDVSSDDASGSKGHRVDVFLLTSVATCIIGDKCTQSECAGLFEASNQGNKQAVSFEINHRFRAVPKGAPEIDTAQQSTCMNIALTPKRLSELRAMLNSFAQHVASWTDGSLVLDLVIHELGPVKMGMTTSLGNKWSGFWTNAPDSEQLIRPHLTKETDFVFVVNGITDASTGYHFNPAAIGMAVKPGLGVAGASYAWVAAEAATEDAFMHEWMHLLKWALHEVSQFDDIYPFSYPACGDGDPKTTRWFPDIHDCYVDPDYKQCKAGGESNCAGGLDFAEHILRAHWPRDQQLVVNVCQSDDPLLRLFQECLP